MAINYKPLWKQLIDKDMMKVQLIELADITSNVMAKMGKNEYISLRSLEKICIALNCTPNEVIAFEKREDIRE